MVSDRNSHSCIAVNKEIGYELYYFGFGMEPEQQR